MSLNIPDNANEIVQRAKTDVQRVVQESNPFLKNSWFSALITGYGNRIFDFYIQLKEAIKQSFPDTAENEFLERWAAIWSRIRNAATNAQGNIVATGTTGTVITINTSFVASDGKIYTSDSAVTITSSIIAITSITRSGQTAAVTTISNHNLANNVLVTIIGAVETQYNVVSAMITVTALNTFTYQVIGSPSTPATGTITVSHTSIPVFVTSVGFGQLENQIAGTELKLQSPIVGVSDQLNVDFGEIGGGTDKETDTGLRLRLLDRIQNPVAMFNVAAIISIAKTISGVTRVFVQEITPSVGQVTVYFMRDDDINSIPTASEVLTVNNKIQSIRPANTDIVDVIVLSPTGISVDFTFTTLSPNTSTMKNAITANLQQFFAEETFVGSNINQDSYRSAIFNTVDTVTGDRVISFTLTTPIGNIVIATGEIGILSNIIYP